MDSNHHVYATLSIQMLNQIVGLCVSFFFICELKQHFTFSCVILLLLSSDPFFTFGIRITISKTIKFFCYCLLLRFIFHCSRFVLHGCRRPVMANSNISLRTTAHLFYLCRVIASNLSLRCSIYYIEHINELRIPIDIL